jgi:hypothetical protein
MPPLAMSRSTSPVGENSVCSLIVAAARVPAVTIVSVMSAFSLSASGGACRCVA